MLTKFTAAWNLYYAEAGHGPRRAKHYQTMPNEQAAHRVLCGMRKNHGPRLRFWVIQGHELFHAAMCYTAFETPQVMDWIYANRERWNKEADERRAETILRVGSWINADLGQLELYRHAARNEGSWSVTT